MKSTRSSPESSAPISHACHRCEWPLVLIVLVVFAAFNIITAPYSPDPWLDEVAYTDPAASLALDGRFTSTLWPQQETTVWTGNMPLHQLAQACAFKVFGFSGRTARSVNVVYYTVAVLLVYWMVRRWQLIRDGKGRAILLLVLLGGTGLTAIYRNGRYDAIGMLACAGWAACALLSQRSRMALIGVTAAAGAALASGLANVPFLSLAGAGAFVLWRWQTVPVLLFSAAGGITGFLAVHFGYRAAGVEQVFQHILQAAGGDRLFDVTMATVKNPSYMAALGVGGLALFGLRRTSIWQGPTNRLAASLVLFGLLTPLVMAATGKYQFYYSWMAIIPATIGSLMLMEKEAQSRAVWLVGAVVLIVATLPGFPRRCLRIAGSWGENRPAQIAGFVGQNTSSTDVVYVSDMALPVYYALRPRAARVYWVAVPTNRVDRASVNLVILSETNRHQWVESEFGGGWETAASRVFGAGGHAFLDPPVPLAVYRRAGKP